MVGRGKRTTLIIPVLLALAVLQTQAEEKEADQPEAMQAILANALKVNISARILPPDEEQEDKPVWNAESSKLTLPGRSIKMRLEGDNVRIYLICTPYVQEDGGILLVAQGQVWLTEPTDKEVKYSSTFYSIPVTFGEKVLFFPLGLSTEEVKQKGYFNIELEINIVPYAENSEEK